MACFEVQVRVKIAHTLYFCCLSLGASPMPCTNTMTARTNQLSMGRRCLAHQGKSVVALHQSRLELYLSLAGHPCPAIWHALPRPATRADAPLTRSKTHNSSGEQVDPGGELQTSSAERPRGE